MELITGGTGIVGSHLLLERTAAGAKVRALYRPNSDRAQVERTFRFYRPDADALLQRIEWVTGDLHDVPALEDAMQGVQHVYHAAALVSFDPRDDRALYRQNVRGTANVVNAALLAGVERLCHVSSTAAIGSAAPGVERNESSPWEDDARHSPYARSKYQAELEVYRGMAEGLDAVLVNPCIVLGPGAVGRSSMTLVERLRKGTRYYPAGSNAVVDARDVASCMARLMREGGSGERYLLVGTNLSYQRLFTALAEALGSKAPQHPLPDWLLDLGVRAGTLQGLFGMRPFITRHTAQSARTQRAWSNAKVSALLGHHFRDLPEMVANVAAYVQGRKTY
ncbi:MAG: NAD-dependent epimerase/dehydratase family protein [Flavobacteriales bacterium]|nr:NAD-dependent epimerase/dehydratase family protein [Flavobacteriales bacterium]